MVACLKQLSKTMLLDILSPTLVALSGNNYFQDLPTTMVALSGMAVCLKQLYLPNSCMFIFAAWSTWSTHNNGCTDAKKPFSSKFSFQSPAGANLTRSIHLFQSTMFNIHNIHFQFNLWSQEVPEDSFCFENISILCALSYLYFL